MNARMYEPTELTGALREAFNRFGGLTSEEIASLNKPMEAPAAPRANLRLIEDAFAAALSRGGVKQPRLRLGGFDFKGASSWSKNPGAVYVVDQRDVYMGKIKDGVFTRSRECSLELENAVLAAAADPFNACVKFGRETGACSVCGRTLTDPESVQRGIGPICAQKFGWA